MENIQIDLDTVRELSNTVKEPAYSYEALRNGVQCGKFLVKLATSPEEVQQVQRLRFEVFNEELGEGIPENGALGLDQDEYDQHCDHLMLVLEDKVVATYRLLYGRERPTQGFYSETEFSIQALGIDFDSTVELGRACVHPKYRMKTTLMSVFWGMHLYVEARGARYLMGCSSLSVTNDNDAEATFEALKSKGKVHFIEGLDPLPKNSFKGEAASGAALIPPLLGLYLEFGAKVFGRPAYDPVFKCYDMFMVFDMQNLSQWGIELLARFDKRLLGQNESNGET